MTFETPRKSPTPDKLNQPPRKLWDTQILKPDEVPSEVRALREKYDRDNPEKPRPSPPSSEQAFASQKAQLLTKIQELIDIAERRINVADRKLKNPTGRTRHGGEKEFQSDDALIAAKKAGEEELLVARLQLACMNNSRATTLEAFSEELERAQAEAARELQRANDENAEKTTLDAKRRTLQVLMELKHIMTT